MNNPVDIEPDRIPDMAKIRAVQDKQDFCGTVATIFQDNVVRMR